MQLSVCVCANNELMLSAESVLRIESCCLAHLDLTHSILQRSQQPVLEVSRNSPSAGKAKAGAPASVVENSASVLSLQAA